MAREAGRGGTTADAGEELKYNRRNRLDGGIRWEDIQALNPTLRVKETTKENVYPRPDYESLVAGGMKPLVAHIVKQAYDAIAAMPVVRGAPTDADLQTYIAGVTRVMDGVMAWSADNNAVSQWVKTQASVAGAMIGRPVSMLDMLPATSLVERVYPGGTAGFKTEFWMVGGTKVSGALRPGYEEVRRALKAIERGWPAKMEAWQKQGLVVAETAEVVKVAVGTTYKDRKEVSVYGVQINDTWLNGYSEDRTVMEARAAEFKPWLLLDKHNRVKQQGMSREEVVEAARGLTKRTSKRVLIATGSNVADAFRRGPTHRKEGEDTDEPPVTVEMLCEEFPSLTALSEDVIALVGGILVGA